MAKANALEWGFFMGFETYYSECATCRQTRSCIIGAAGGMARMDVSARVVVEVVEAGNGIAETSRSGQLVGVLRSGLMRLDRVDARGRRHMLGLVLPGEPVGELLPTGSSAHAVTALVTSRVCRFDDDRGTDYSRFLPQVRHRLLSSYSVRLARLQSILWIRASLSVNARVAALLLMASRFMRTSPLADGAILLTSVLPRHDAAELLGTTVESFCRALHVLENEGLIVIRDSRRFELRDVAGLERLSALDGAYLDKLFPCGRSRKPLRSRRAAATGLHAPPALVARRARSRSTTVTEPIR